MAHAHVDFKVFQRKLINFVILAFWLYVGSFKNWCDRESNEMLVLMLQGKKTKTKYVFYNFCALRGSKLVCKIPKFFFSQGASPPWTPQRVVFPAPHRSLGGPLTPAIQAQYSPSTFSNAHAWVILVTFVEIYQRRSAVPVSKQDMTNVCKA